VVTFETISPSRDFGFSAVRSRLVTFTSRDPNCWHF